MDVDVEVGNTGHAGALTVSLRNRDPISSYSGLITIPPAVIVYICSHINWLIVTVATLSSIKAEPENMVLRYYARTYAHMYIWINNI